MITSLRRIGVGGALILIVWLASFGVLLTKTVPVSGDGIYYFVQLESLTLDHDVDYANNLERFRANPYVAKQLDSGVTTPTGRTPNLFSIGPALLWSPVYVVVHFLAPQAELLAPSLATGLCVLVGLVCLYRALRRLGFIDTVAGLAVTATYLGTNLIYYSIFEASMAHGLGFALVSLLLLLALRSSKKLLGALVFGVIAGLAVDVRWQLLLAVVPLGVLAFFHLKTRNPRTWLAAAVGFALGVLPQLLVWKALYGSFLVLPQGAGFIVPTSPHFGEVLWSARHGLITWTPLVLLAVVGVVLAARTKNAAVRAVALVSIVILFLQTYLNGSLIEWWGGDAFGARRFTDVTAVFAFGLAALFAATKPKWRAVLASLVALLVLANLTLMQLYRHDRISRSLPVHVRAAVEALRH
ncbi:MAG: hypothetical protein U0517_02500 [Candidatus Andersenbacteria bacterium]